MWRTLAVLQLVVALVALQVADVSAKRSRIQDTGPGCGLGKMVWAEYKQQKQIEAQVMISTTNQIGSQSLALSFGTWDCTSRGRMTAGLKIRAFAALNFENLSQDMARGQGEHLTSLAALMGIPAEYQAEFFALTQQEYPALIQSEETTPAAMLTSLRAAIAGYPILAQLSTAQE